MYRGLFLRSALLALIKVEQALQKQEANRQLAMEQAQSRAGKKAQKALKDQVRQEELENIGTYIHLSLLCRSQPAKS